MWVVKLGGSLFGRPELRRWLAELSHGGGVPRLIVPGGGAFADFVRRKQAPLHLDALAAHRMAILAMQQSALALASLEPKLTLVETMEEIVKLRASNGAAIWLPWRLIGLDTSIEASWDVTSDSLALWLARQVTATRVILVKVGEVPPRSERADILARQGLVDQAFPDFARWVSCPVMILPSSAFLADNGCRVFVEDDHAGAKAAH